MMYSTCKLNKEGDNIQPWHTPFPIWNQSIHCPFSGSNCCFLTCIQVSQETGKVVTYSHLFKNFPQFVVIHTVKEFSVVNEAEVNVFLEFLWFFYDPSNVGNLISGSSAFSKSSLHIWKFSVHVLVETSTVLSHFSHVRLFATLWTIAHQDLCPWDSPGKNTEVGWHFLLQRIFPTQELNPGLLCPLTGRWVLYHWYHMGSPHCQSLAWRTLRITLLACEMSAVVW